MKNNLDRLLGYLLEDEAVSRRPFMLSLDNLVAHRDSLFDAYEHCVYRNRCSESSGPIVVAEIEDGKYQLIDGYHRLIEHLLDRGGLVPIRAILGGIGSGEYAIARGVDRWLGDATMRYGNLEDLTDEETLEGHANKRKNAKKGDLFENGVGGGETDIDIINNLNWQPINFKIWKTLKDDEGWTEEYDIKSKSDLEMSEYPITDIDKSGLKMLDFDTVEKFNRFDINIKEKYGAENIIDLIDYDKGQVVLVRRKLIK